MPAIKVLARGWFLEAQNPDTMTWLEVKGINSLTFDGNKNDADTTTFDNEGWNTHLVASRGRTIGLEGFYLEDPANGNRDEGQALVDSINDKIGYESLGNFRLTSPSGTVREFVASANVSGIGGGNDDPTGWSVELTVSGDATFATPDPSAGISAFAVRNPDDDGAVTAISYVPSWDIDTFVYVATYTTDASFRIRATAVDHSIKMYVNGEYHSDLNSGVSSAAILLGAEESKAIKLVVREVGKSAKTYDITVARTS